MLSLPYRPAQTGSSLALTLGNARFVKLGVERLLANGSLHRQHGNRNGLCARRCKIRLAGTMAA